MSPRIRKPTPDNSINFDNQIVIPEGHDYDARRNKFKQEWRESYANFASKVCDVSVRVVNLVCMVLVWC